MAAKYHITPEGNPGKCKAKIKCPFAGEGQHYESADQARAVYEASNQAFTPTEVKTDAGAAAHYEALPYGHDLRDFEVSTAIESAFHFANYRDPNPKGVATVAAIVARTADNKQIERCVSTPTYMLNREDDPVKLAKYVRVLEASLTNPAMTRHTYNAIAIAAKDGQHQSGDARRGKRALIQSLIEDKRTDRVMRMQLKKELAATN